VTEGIDVSVHELVALKRLMQRQHEPILARAQQPGQRVSKLRGRGMDFSETRHYQAGDEIRYMDWRVTARTGSPHVKLYQQERERPVILLADFNPSLFFGTRVALKSVVVAKVAALIAWRAIKAGDRVGALLFASNNHHQELIPRSRDKGILPLLSSLSEFSQLHRQTEAATPLSQALIRLRRVAKPGSLITIISDFYHLDDVCERHLKRLRQHNDIVFYAVVDPLEQTLPEKGLYGISDGEHQLVLDTALPEVIKAFRQQHQQREKRLAQICQATQIDCYTIRSDAEYAHIINQSLQGRRYG
jgi:uncharacterized protein (DUF58 family)